MRFKKAFLLRSLNRLTRLNNISKKMPVRVKLVRLIY